MSTQVATEITSPVKDRPRRMAAIAAGIGLLLMTVAAIFAAATQGSVFVPGDPAATASNILADEPQVRLAVVSFLVVVALDVLVAWGLYVFLRPVNKELSLLAGWFRLVYAAVFAAAILNLAIATSIVHSAATMSVLDTEQMQAQVWLALNAFSTGWNWGLGLFGLHLTLVGYLMFGLKAGNLPGLLGILLLIAGLGYVFDSVVGILLPEFGVTIGQFTFVGELLLAVWLVVIGVSTKQWTRLIREPY